MKKRSHFTKTFELTLIFMKYAVVSISLGLVFLLLANALQADSTEFNQQVKIAVSTLGNFLALSGLAIFLLSTPFIIREIRDRVVNDKISNYSQSILKTLLLRRFLKQEEMFTPLSIDNNSKPNVNSKITKQFNFWIRFSLIDVRQDEITVMIVIPPSQQAQKQLQTMIEQIREQINSMNEDYYISAPVRENHLYWFRGKRRR